MQVSDTCSQTNPIGNSERRPKRSKQFVGDVEMYQRQWDWTANQSNHPESKSTAITRQHTHGCAQPSSAAQQYQCKQYPPGLFEAVTDKSSA